MFYLQRTTRPHRYFLLGLLLLTALAGWLRVSSLGFWYTHPDEEITVGVSGHMRANGTLDSNWKNVDLTSYFRYPQYNFSGYIMGSAALLALADAPVAGSGERPLSILRYTSAVLGTLAVLLTGLLGARLFGALTGLGAAALLVANPLLYQDSLYARPEPFVTCLVLLLCLMVLPGKPVRDYRMAPLERWSRLPAAVIAGVLVATKVSLLAVVPLLFLVPARAAPGAGLSAYLEAVLRAVPALLPVVAAGLLAGFVAGAPYALLNFGDYLHGITYLTAQYTDGMWPHGLAAAGLLPRLGYAAHYFAATSGIGPWLLALAGGVLALRRGHYPAVLLFVLVMVVALRFATYATFFERNLSHLLPIVSIFAAYAVVRLAQAIAAPAARIALILVGILALCLPGALTSAGLRFQELPGLHYREVRALRLALEEEYGVRTTIVGFSPDYAAVRHYVPDLCAPRLLEFPHPGDPVSDEVLAQLARDAGYREVGRVPSLFADVPPSTLHTYFTSTKVFLTNAGARAPGCVEGGAPSGEAGRPALD